MVFLTGSATLKASELAQSGIGWSRIGAALAAAKGRVLMLIDRAAPMLEVARRRTSCAPLYAPLIGPFLT